VVRASGTAIVERRVSDVFAYLTEVANAVAWHATELFVDPLTPPPLGIGSQFLEVTQKLGHRFESVVEVVAFEPPFRFTCKAVESPAPYEIDYRLSAAGEDRTRLVIEIAGDSAGYFGLAERVVQAATEREIATALGNVKDILEDRAEA
jgi:hypothetical protein